MNLSIDLTYFSMVKERKCIILSPEMLSMSGGEAEGGGGSSLERKSRRESSARVFFTVHTIYIHLLFVHGWRWGRRLCHSKLDTSLISLSRLLLESKVYVIGTFFFRFFSSDFIVFIFFLVPFLGLPLSLSVSWVGFWCVTTHFIVFRSYRDEHNSDFMEELWALSAQDLNFFSNRHAARKSSDLSWHFFFMNARANFVQFFDDLVGFQILFC